MDIKAAWIHNRLFWNYDVERALIFALKCRLIAQVSEHQITYIFFFFLSCIRPVWFAGSSMVSGQKMKTLNLYMPQ